MKHFILPLLILTTLITLLLMGIMEIYAYVKFHDVAGFSVGVVISLIMVSLIFSLPYSVHNYYEKKK